MNLEIWSQLASVFSAIFALLALIGIGVTYKVVNKQSNKNNVVVNGSAMFEGSFNVSNKVDKNQ
ncbi:MAG: hypothetical protein RIT04_553 [Candidatus Parcubacteria bacterium]|jgi:hypothetical protein